MADVDSEPEVPAEKDDDQVTEHSDSNAITAPKFITVLIICLLNLMNFIDRYSVPGMLPYLIEEFNLSDLQGGLLQSSFVVTYVILAPIIGYLGDRYSRRVIMATGVFIGSSLTFAGTFTNTFNLLITFRCFSGVAEASYAAIGPAIIGDIFVGDNRSKMLTLFYFTTLLGGGLGFVFSSTILQLTGSWQWGLRVAPILGFISVILVVFVMKDPPRGESEGSHLTNTSGKDDLRYLFSNRSFMLSTFGSSSLVFTLGALAAWGPKLMFFGRKTVNDTTANVENMSLIYGILTIVSGIVGVISGSLMSQKLRPSIPTVDALICGFGLSISSIFFYFSFLFASGNVYVTYTLVFFGLLFLNLNWALVGDILLYVVIPPRRATAETLQIVITHLLGDAGSSFITGWIADGIRPHIEHYSADYQEFKALQYSLFSVIFMNVLGSFLFIVTGWYLVEDRAKVDRAVASNATEEEASA